MISHDMYPPLHMTYVSSSSSSYDRLMSWRLP